MPIFLSVPTITGDSTIHANFKGTDEVWTGSPPRLYVRFHLMERTGTAKLLYPFPSTGEFLDPEESFYACYYAFHFLPVSDHAVMRRLLQFVSQTLTEVATEARNGRLGNQVLVMFWVTCTPPPCVVEEMDGNAEQRARGVHVPRLEKARYEDGMGLREDCSICIEDFREGDEIIKIPCSHIFHDRCLSRWMMRGRVCPLCRSELPTEV